MDKNDKSPGTWKPINYGWKYMNYVIVGVGLIVGFCVWALPNRWADPEIEAGMAKLREREARIKEWNIQQEAIKAEEARIAKENEEMGLVYIEPGTNPFLPPPSQREPEKK